jgi:GAF domain-containing protein
VHAQLGHDVIGIHQHVEQVRHRRALVAAHIAHARLQQRLGDGENAFAAELGAVAQPQCLHFGLERAFHRGLAWVPASRHATLIKRAITAVAVSARR